MLVEKAVASIRRRHGGKVFLGGGVHLFFLWPILVQSTQDKVVLKNGAVLEGKIISETDRVLEVSLGEGQIVGVLRREASEILRGVPKPTGVGEISTTMPSIPAQDDWFQVEDRNGKVIGSCRFVSRPEVEKSVAQLHVEMQWTFFEKDGELRVSWIEKLTPDLIPKSLIYREEGCGAGKLVLAVLRQGRLEVEISAGELRRRVELPWAENSQFPLSLRLLLRKRAFDHPQQLSFLVFDPAQASFRSRKFSIGDRKRIPFDEQETPVFVVREESSPFQDEEWIEPKSGTISWECNGPDLVLKRKSAEEVAALRAGPPGDSLPVLVQHPRGWFRLSLLDSTWENLGPKDSDTLWIKNAAGDSSVMLFPMSSSTRGDNAIAQLPALEKRLSQSLEKYQRLADATVRILQGRAGIEFPFQYVEGVEARSGRVLLLPTPDDSLVFLYSYPLRDARSIPVEWERWIARLELK